MAQPWIITLHAGASPALIPEPRGLMADYDFYTSRTLEDGRERYRLHLGFFDDLPKAKTILRVVRETYPAAWLVPADQYQGLRRTYKELTKEVAVELSGPPAVGMPPPAAMAPVIGIAVPAEEGAALDAAEVFALLGGAADLLAGVLPDIRAETENAGIALEGLAASAALEAGADPYRRTTDALIRDVSRFIVEEWQPEARRPHRPPAERAWYLRFRPGKRAARTQNALP